MKLYNGELTVRNEQAGSTVAIQSGTTLSEIVEQTDLYEVPYMLVLDDTDRLLGIASSVEVLDRTLRRNLRERERWLGMPVDSVMLPMHDLCMQRTSSDSFFALRSRTTIQCTPIVDNDRVVAVVNGNDLLVSYQGVESLLLRAMTDPVTGLPTRSVFQRRLGDEWKRAIATGESVSVILIDVDISKKLMTDAVTTWGMRCCTWSVPACAAASGRTMSWLVTAATSLQRSASVVDRVKSTSRSNDCKTKSADSRFRLTSGFMESPCRSARSRFMTRTRNGSRKS